MKKYLKKILTLSSFFPLVSFAFYSFSFIQRESFLTNNDKEQVYEGNVIHRDFRSNEVLPTKYDPRGTEFDAPVKNQATDPLCWAFSTASLAENNLLKNKIYPDINKNNIRDISINANNINFATRNWLKEADKLNLTFDDYKESDLVSGFYTSYANVKLSMWYGTMVFEKEMPANKGNEYGTSAAYLNEYVFLDDNNKTIDNIKQAIKKYGGVTFSYNSAILSTNGSNYYNLKKGTVTHNSVIVGWDDTISKDLFTRGDTPSRDGAWIVKNSWGPGAHDDGYYYASYDSYIVDVTAANYGSPNEYRDANYYHYDVNYESYTLPIIKESAAIYPALKTSYNKKEFLKEVSFELGGQNVTVEVSVYTDLKNIDTGIPKSPKNNPTKGILVHQEQATYQFPGMYFLRLNKPVELPHNKPYSVVIKIISGEHDGTSEPIIKTTKEPLSRNDMTFYKDKNNEWKNLLNNSSVARVRAITYTEDDKNANLENAKNLNYGQVVLNQHYYNYKSNKSLDFDVYINDKKLVRNQDYKLKSRIERLGIRGVDFPAGKMDEIIGSGTLIVEGIGEYSGQLSKNYSLLMPYTPNLDELGVYKKDYLSQYMEMSIDPSITKYSQIKLPKDWKWLVDENKDITFDTLVTEHLMYTGSENQDYYWTFYPKIIFKKSSGGGSVTPNPNPDPTPTPDPTPAPDPNPDPTIKNLSNAIITFLDVSSYYYTGKEIRPTISVSYEGSTLVENTDYTLTYENNLNVGTAKVIVNGLGNYNGAKESAFTIQKIVSNTITHFEIKDNKPVASATFGEVKFRYSTDETFSSGKIYDEYPNDEGTYYVQAYVVGTNNYNEVISNKQLKIFVSNSSSQNQDDLNVNNANNKNSLSKTKLIIICSIVASIIIVGSTVGIVSWMLLKKRKKK
ncbi:C1 family peptidase [Malacoplasma muris]|uniref:C1 family peptidase n=1 Tax=Malacoplasma muris TaxID=2119 RepID=UPI00398F72CB